jgi:hypothetical protein
MSTPDEQKLIPHIRSIRDGIKGFHIAAQARVDSDDGWKPGHLSKLANIRSRFIDLDIELAELERTTT